MNRKKTRIIIGICIALGIAVFALVALIATVIRGNSDKAKDKKTPAGQQGTAEPSGESDPDKKYPGSYVRDTYAVNGDKRTKLSSEESDLDAEGREIRFYSWYEAYWPYTGVITEGHFSYDSLGRKESEKWSHQYESDPGVNNVFGVKYEYDGETDRVRFKRTYDEKGNLVETDELRYNERGDVILDQTTLADGTLVSAYEREYDEFGNLLYERQENHGYHGQENTYPPIVTVEYDPAQRKVTAYNIREEYNEEGSYQERIKRSELYYDESGRLIREKSFSEVDNAVIEDYSVEYFYGGGRTCAKSIKRNSDGYVTEKEFDDSGRVVLIWEYHEETPEESDKSVFDWDAEDPALPGQKVLRESRYVDYFDPDGTEDLTLDEESWYLLNWQESETLGLLSSEYYKSELSCFSTTLFESNYRTPKGSYNLEVYSQTKFYSDESVRYVETVFDANGRKVSRNETFNRGRTRHTEYDDHGNIVKEILDYGADSDYVPTETVYEYTYY